MSSTSEYEPDIDDGDPESDFDEPSEAPSSPALDALTISSSPDDPDSDITHPRLAWLWSQLRQLPPVALEEYKALLSESENGTQYVDNEEPHLVTQNGAVLWTPTEKEALFNALDRQGKNGIPEIAAAIGTKSELEVMDHLRLLHRSLEVEHLFKSHIRPVAMADIPAAEEVSVECGAVLDQFAEVLVADEEHKAAIERKREHGLNWVITETRAQKIKDGENQDTPREGVSLASDLLNVPIMVQLSRRVFMNLGGSRSEDNWTNLVMSEDEEPSMTADALQEFYALVISITRRLIQSSIFFAMSRLRTVQRRGKQRTSAVRKRDVRTALDVLNMKRDRSDFWIKLARRNHLEVADMKNQKGWVPRVFSYDEIEKILSGDDDYFKLVSETGVLPDDQPAEPAEEEEEEEDVGSPPSRASSELSSPLSESELSLLDPEDEHADILDRERSRRGELRLWNKLEQPAPSFLDEPIKEEDDENDPEKNKEVVRKPHGERKTKQDLVDWRDHTLYRSEWEDYGYGMEDLEEELAENRRKRRRLDDSPAESPREHLRHRSPRSVDIESDQDVEDHEVQDYELGDHYVVDHDVEDNAAED
ncbi:hypothetical protein N7474_001603 [Penicillium riverlandense]|uniref:uncharacterized protein n=1 Tax=Penicillium riverlandense TaxID=1903569 RepID=UPI002546DC75|nr:uncharacterized protein N7474_001603 [Penicillium riverlandense]KAJ5833292.1 hypothetical protein N7474_001603 [Penicillium riverlandense]